MQNEKEIVIFYTSDFQKAYRELPVKIQDIVDKKEAIFRKNPRYPSLQTHRLHAPLEALWRFYVTKKKYRVLFEFVANGALFHDVGTHDIYR